MIRKYTKKEKIEYEINNKHIGYNTVKLIYEKSKSMYNEMKKTMSENDKDFNRSLTKLYNKAKELDSYSELGSTLTNKIVYKLFAKRYIIETPIEDEYSPIFFNNSNFKIVDKFINFNGSKLKLLNNTLKFDMENDIIYIGILKRYKKYILEVSYEVKVEEIKEPEKEKVPMSKIFFLKDE